ncbi:MAG: septum formation initiator family protein [Bacilli bacterium]
MAKRRKKISKVSKRRLVFFTPLCLMAFIYFSYCLFSSSVKLYDLRNTKDNLDEQLFKLKENEEELKIEIERLNDPDYLARFARENYLYSKDGEYVIKVEDDKKKKPVLSKRMVINYDVIIMITGGLLVVIIICVLRKKTTKQ